MTILKQVFLLVASFLFVLVLGEFFIKYAKISEVSFAEYYHDIGKGLAKPNTYVLFNEGFGIKSTNSSRFIGENVPLKKDKNTIRIALIGDSHLESIEVFERHSFSYILKDILNKKINDKNIKIEVLNFGRHSFNIGNMYAYQRLLVDQFKPDYNLYFIANDNLKCDYTFPPLLPITTIAKNSLKISTDKNKEDFYIYQKTKVLTQNFVFANILNACRKTFKNKETLSIILDKFYTKKTNKEIQNKIIKNDKLDSITRKIINVMDSNTIIINRDENDLPLNFKNLCLSNNLTYLDLSPTFKKLNKNGNVHKKWPITNKYGHWNQKTHEAIGLKIADEMNQIITRNK